jgi:hypothetical protein
LVQIYHFENNVASSPDKSGNPFLKETLFFLGTKKRPAEALFGLRKKGIVSKRLERLAGLASKKKSPIFGRLYKKWQATYIAPLNHIPLLCSHPGGVCRSWSCRTCRCKDTIFLFFCKKLTGL